MFLKNIGTLASLGYPLPVIEDLTNSTEAYVDKSLKLFKEKMPEKSSDERAENQAWKMISMILPEFCNHTLDRIFCAAIHIAPSASEEDTQQVFTRLKENQGVDLNQIYRERYAAQFLNWVQNEVYALPASSLLLLLNVWQCFGQSTHEVTWNRLLSLPNWSKSQKNKSQKQVLDNFKLKYDFMIKNHKAFQYIKLKESNSVAPSIKKDICKHCLNQYVVWVKAINSLLSQIAEAYGCLVVGFQKDSWEYQLLHTPRKISSNILIRRGQKVFASFQEKIQEIENFLDKRLKSLKEQQQNAQENQKQLNHALKENIPIFLSKGMTSKAMETIAIKDAEKRGKVAAKEQIEHFLGCWKRKEELAKDELNKFMEFKQGIANVELLRKQLTDSFLEKPEQQKISQEQIARIEKNQRELLEEESKCISESVQSKKTFLVELSSGSDSEIEELSESFSEIQSSTDVSDLPVSFAEIDLFLNNPNQVNGVLSKSIKGILKQLKAHILKTQTDTPYELKALQKEKAHEIHTQLVLATAAQEQVIQAIQDQRWDHVVLGFRSAFIHCHFAVEQTLSLKILLEDNEITTTHDLIQLAEKAKIEKLQESREFLQDIAVHLWFCYPEDYRFFSAKEAYPQPFVFLEKLFHPYQDVAGQKLDIDLLKEAIQLCFTRYNQTIEFIVAVSLAPVENLNWFLKKINQVQKQIQNRIEEAPKKHSKNLTCVKYHRVLDILNSLDLLDNLPDFEGRVPLNTIKEYLRLMEISLEIPQKSNIHSLQKFLQIETLANMDKLFKHLFRVIILLQTGEDNHSHNLLALVPLIENFYTADVLQESDKHSLKEINLGITHHYLYKESSAVLKKDYKNIFHLGRELIVAESGFAVKYKKHNISYKTLEAKIKVMLKKLDSSLDLFIKLLNPVVSELKQLNDIS